MTKKSILFILAPFVLLILFFVSYSAIASSPKENLDAYCTSEYFYKKECPQRYCNMQCIGGVNYPDCHPECVPKPCLEYTRGDCPKDQCELLRACNGQDVCYDKIDDQELTCGRFAYPGQKAPCCDGLVKRCGIEFYDGTCDMSAEGTALCVPVCLPCGDGKCGNLENRCNCPEDCGEAKESR